MAITGATEPAPEQEIREKILTAFETLRSDYERAGSWRYPGALDADESWGWVGTWCWSEADIQHRFASLLDEQFGREAVHLEMPINERMRSDLDPLPPEKKRRTTTYIDLVVTDLAELAALPQTADGAGAAFRARRHEAFIEVKWRSRGAERWLWHDYRTFSTETSADIERLHLHRQAGRCTVAAMLVVDNRGSFWSQLQSEQRFPDDVLLLPLTPPNVAG